jgi:hypothetical protein
MDEPQNDTEETARRREHIRLADAENRIDGLFRDPESDVVFDAYIRGEIAVTDIIPRLRLFSGTR